MGLGVFIGVEKNGSKTVADVYNNFIEFAQEGFNFESRLGGSLDVDFYHNETSEVLIGVSFIHSGTGRHDAHRLQLSATPTLMTASAFSLATAWAARCESSRSQDNAVFGGIKGFNHLTKSEPSSGGFFLNGDLISFPSVSPMPGSVPETFAHGPLFNAGHALFDCQPPDRHHRCLRSGPGPTSFTFSPTI